MNQWIFWAVGLATTTVIGIIAFFLKRTYTGFESKMAELREDSNAQVRHAQEAFQKENAAIREDFRASMDSLGKRIEKVENTIQDMPYKYTLKEDFIRSMSAVDKKLDKSLKLVDRKE